MYIDLHVEYPLFLSDFNGTFSRDFRKILKSLMTTRPVEAKYYHADGQTDMTKLTVAFRNFANVPKNDVRWRHNINKENNTGAGLLRMK